MSEKDKEEIFESKPAKVIEKNWHGTETILLVEDDNGVRKFAYDALRNFGYKVFAASNGVNAIKKIKDEKIKVDLLMTDLVMPEMNGKELSETIKKNFPDIRILFSSGYTNNHLVHRGELDKNINFLQKPYSMQALLEKVHEVLRKK